jgi:hypothetical protein
MKRIHIVGLCLVAAVAFSAMASASASAAEYGSCHKLEWNGIKTKHGQWANENCTVPAAKPNKGAYYWAPGPPANCVLALKKKGEYTEAACLTKSAKPKKGHYEREPCFPNCAKYTSVTGKALLSTPGLGASEVECTGGAGFGEITGVKTGVTTTTFTGCSTAKHSSTCTSSQLSSPPGTIATYELNTTLVGNPEKNKNGGAGPVPGEVWTRFTGKAPHEKYLAIFDCTGVAWFSAQGWNAGFQRGNVNVMSVTGKTEIHEGTGEQFQVTEVCENNEFEPGPCKHGQAGPSPSLQEVAGAESKGTTASEIKS